MASAPRQFVARDPHPSNTGMMSGSPERMFIAFPLATVSGSTLVSLATVAVFSGTTVTGFSDSVNGAWSSGDDIQTGSPGVTDAHLYYFQNAAALPAGDVGVSTGGSSTTVVDTSKSWTTNQWVGATIWDPGLHSSTVTANTATTITFSGGTLPGSGGFGSGADYAVGSYLSATFSAFDDYNGITSVEVSGAAASSYAGHSAAAPTSGGAGTDNVSSGASGTVAAAAYGVLSFSFNDTTGAGAPGVGGGATSLGTCFRWSAPADGARAQFRSVTLGSPATITSLFSAVDAAEHLTFQVILADATIGTTITPNAAGLALALTAPTVINPLTITPARATLSLTGLAPVGAGTLLRPSTGVLLLSTRGTLTAATANLGINGFTPALVQSAVIVPAPAALQALGRPVVVRPIDPPAAALVLASQSPTLLFGTVIAPPVVATVLTGQQPIVTLSGSQTITPGVGALVVAGQSAARTVSTFLQAAAAVLAITGQQPQQTLTVPAPATAVLTIANFAPVVTQGSPASNTTITPSAAALVLAGQLPSMSGVITTATGGLALTSRLATAVAGFVQTPIGTTVSIAGQAPQVVVGVIALPGVTALSLGVSTPSLLTSNVRQPSAGALTIAGQLASLTSITVPTTGALALQGQPPTLSLQGQLSPATTILALQGQPPALLVAALVQPSVGVLTLAGSPAVASANVLPALGAGALALQGQSPVLATATVLSPATAVLTISGQAVRLSAAITISPNAAALVVAGGPPQLLLSAVRTPNAGALSTTGQSLFVINPVAIAPQTGALVLQGCVVALIATSPYTPTQGFTTALPEHPFTAVMPVRSFTVALFTPSPP